MEGFRDKLKGLLGNPFVQGVGTAAAFGANPALGLLMGHGIKKNRDEQQYLNDLRRQRLADDKRVRELTTTEAIKGIETQKMQSEIGLLDPVTFEEELIPFSGRREHTAIPQLDAMGNPMMLSQTPRGQQELAGIFAASADPARAQYGAQALTAGTAPTTNEKDAAAYIKYAVEAGVDSETIQTGVAQIYGATNPMVELQIASAQADLVAGRIAIKSAEDEENRKFLESSLENTTIANSFLSSGKQLMEMGDILSEVQELDLGSFADPGSFANRFAKTFASGASMLGEALGDPEAAADYRRYYDLRTRFDAVANLYAENSMATSGFDLATDSARQHFRSGKPSFEEGTYMSNSLLIADALDSIAKNLPEYRARQDKDRKDERHHMFGKPDAPPLNVSPYTDYANELRAVFR